MKKSRLMELANVAVTEGAAMSAVEADDMAVEILNHLMDNDIIERGFDEELATELIVLILTGGPTNNNDIPGFEGTRDALANL